MSAGALRMTVTSQGSTLGSPRSGLKTEVRRRRRRRARPPLRCDAHPTPHPPSRFSSAQVDQLFARVQEHDDSIVRLDATIEKNAVRIRRLPPGARARLAAPHAPLPRARRRRQPSPRSQAIADDSLKAVQASLKASLASLRDEMNRKIQALTIEIAQLQKQMNVGRGEQSILAQQQKDTSKRVDILSTTVSELSAEIVGDDHAVRARHFLLLLPALWRLCPRALPPPRDCAAPLAHCPPLPFPFLPYPAPPNAAERGRGAGRCVLNSRSALWVTFFIIDTKF